MKMAPILNPELTRISLERLQRRHSYKWARYPADVLPAWVAEMDFPLAKPVKRAVAGAVELDDFGYSYPRGIRLAEAFAQFAERRMNWQVDHSTVFPAIGIFSAISSTLGLMMRPGDAVVITPPVYHPFYTLVEELGGRPVEAPLANGKLDVDAVEARLGEGAAALLLCTPHNPTGIVPEREDLLAIAEAAARYGAWVLVDEVHAPLVMPTSHHVPFLTVCGVEAERVIAFCSASKAFNLAGLKCAEVVAASSAAGDLIRHLPAHVTDCGHLGAIASTAAFREGEDWLDDVIAVLDHNRRLIGQFLAEHLPAVGYRMPEAGYLAWLDLNALDPGSDPSVAILEHGRLAVSPGLEFGPQGNGFVRLNFATSPELLEQALERLENALTRRPRRR
jgi:cysteine-S-conjugate beta-lyase